MKTRMVLGLFLILILCSCKQRRLTDDPFNSNFNKDRSKNLSGLLIENGINRGIMYTDSLGTNYNIRYIPITLTNDSTLPIRVQIKFLKEYTNSLTATGEKFNIIPMASEWAMNGAEITNKMRIDLAGAIDKPFTSIVLNPGENYRIGIGTRYPTGIAYGAPLPEMLYVQGDGEDSLICDQLLLGREVESAIGLRLKLIFNKGESNEQCAIISCGHISFFKPGN